MRLLLAEDDLKLARALDRGLRRAGYGVDLAHDGDAALLNARVYDYDAVVLDVMLPARDGFDVCRTMRAEARWAPVLLLTARDQVPDRIHGLDAGADDYLVKPFDFGELLARLRALVRRGPADRGTELRVGDLVLDPAGRRVRRGDAEIPLSTKEFQLLEVFMRHPGEVLSRLALLEGAWDHSYENRSNVIDVYVGYLRDKLDRPFGVVSLETVRGSGYRLHEDGG